MTIEVSIRAESAEEYRNAIKALMDGAGMVGFEIPEGLLANSAPVPSAVEMSIEAEKPAEKPTEKPAEKPAATKAVTMDEVQALGRKMSLAGKLDRVAAVLKTYNVAKLTAIPAEQLANAYADLEAANNE